MKEVDWSKAPEGATHYNTSCRCPWLKETPPSYFDSGNWVEYEPYSFENHFNNSIKRPQVMTIKEWDGIGGVPPIGTVCEYYCSEGDEWRTCEVVAYHNSNIVAVDVEDSTAVCLHSGLGLFRPIKTPEQIAAEERLQAIDEMLSLVYIFSSFKDVMGMLYDAGYRKTKVKK